MIVQNIVKGCPHCASRVAPRASLVVFKYTLTAFLAVESWTSEYRSRSSRILEFENPSPVTGHFVCPGNSSSSYSCPHSCKLSSNSPMSLSGIQYLVVQDGGTVNIVGGNQINTSGSSIDRRFTPSISWPLFSPQALPSQAEASGRHIHRSILARRDVSVVSRQQAWQIRTRHPGSGFSA